MGHLLILSPQTNSSHELFVIASKGNMSNSDWKISVPVVLYDNYAVFLYDLGSNGLPPLLSGDSTGGWRHVLASRKEDVTVTDSGESECENKNISVTDEGNAGGKWYLSGYLKLLVRKLSMLCVSKFLHRYQICFSWAFSMMKIYASAVCACILQKTW